MSKPKTIRKKTLAEYHQTYPARPRDTVEHFWLYERFCAQHPCPTGFNAQPAYFVWYSKLVEWMVKHGQPRERR